ncbi:MAG: LamG-like jellyroll fold domain-containing protein, partial [Planctomycetota bacterium]
MAQAIRYCDRCALMVPPGEMGKALVTGDQILCADCVAALSPEERAAVTGKGRASRATPRRRQPSTRRQRAARRAGPETGRHSPVAVVQRGTPASPRNLVVAGLVVGVVAGVALLFLLSGGRERPERTRPSPAPVKTPPVRAQPVPPPSRAVASPAPKPPEDTPRPEDVPPKPAPRAVRSPGTGPVAWWKFDEPAGAATAVDETGRNNAAVVGATAGAPGKVGTAYRFDGRDDHLRVPALRPANTMSQLTCALWVNIESVPRRYVSIVSHDGWTNGCVHFIFNKVRPEFAICGNAPEDVNTRTVFTRADIGRWVHIAAVYDSAARTARLYRDGLPDGAG